MMLKNLKKGNLFTLKKIKYPEENELYIKGNYNKSTKAYTCVKFNDISKIRYIKGNEKVFTDFSFTYVFSL